MSIVIPISKRQLSVLAETNQAIAEMEAKRTLILEMIIESSEHQGKDLKITKISPAGIEAEEQTLTLE